MTVALLHMNNLKKKSGKAINRQETNMTKNKAEPGMTTPMLLVNAKANMTKQK